MMSVLLEYINNFELTLDAGTFLLQFLQVLGALGQSLP